MDRDQHEYDTPNSEWDERDPGDHDPIEGEQGSADAPDQSAFTSDDPDAPTPIQLDAEHAPQFELEPVQGSGNGGEGENGEAGFLGETVDADEPASEQAPSWADEPASQNAPSWADEPASENAPSWADEPASEKDPSWDTSDLSDLIAKALAASASSEADDATVEEAYLDDTFVEDAYVEDTSVDDISLVDDVSLFEELHKGSIFGEPVEEPEAVTATDESAYHPPADASPYHFEGLAEDPIHAEAVDAQAEDAPVDAPAFQDLAAESNIDAEEPEFECEDEDVLDDAIFDRFDTPEDGADEEEFDHSILAPSPSNYTPPSSGDSETADKSRDDFLTDNLDPVGGDPAEPHSIEAVLPGAIPQSTWLEPPPVAVTGSVETVEEPVVLELASASQEEFGPANLEVRRIEPEVSTADQPITYGFVVRNTAPVPLSNVRVEHVLPDGARCVGVLPRPQVFGNKLIWKVGDMDAGAEHRFLVRVEKGADVTLPSEATAVLHACYFLKAPVARPRLTLTVHGPDKVKVGDQVPVRVELKNTGTGPALDLKLRDVLTAGLEHPDGRVVEAKLGTLVAGGTLQFTVTTTAALAGQQRNVVSLTGAEGLQVSAPWEVLVTEPVLSVSGTAPVRCLVGRQNEYRIDIANSGTAPIDQVLLIDTLPEELEFVSVTEGGQFDASDRSISWVLGSLYPGQLRSFKVEFVAREPGTFVHRALGWTDSGLESVAEVSFVVEIDESRSSHLLEDLLAAIEREDEGAADADALDSPRAVPARPFKGVGEQHIVFTIGEAEYAIPIGNVLEYGHPLSVTPVPGVPDWVVGVANVHGDIISMVDLRLFLGMERLDYDQNSRMLVVRALREDITVGLIVDRVKGIRAVAEDRISLPTSPVEDRLAPYLRGVTAHHGRLLVLLDLEQLLLSSEMRQFEPV